MLISYVKLDHTLYSINHGMYMHTCTNVQPCPRDMYPMKQFLYGDHWRILLIATNPMCGSIYINFIILNYFNTIIWFAKVLHLKFHIFIHIKCVPYFLLYKYY